MRQINANPEKRETFSVSALCLILIAFFSATAFAQTTEFTYQGKLNDANGQAAAYDFIFSLCASETASCASPLATVSQSGVSVPGNGIFTVKLDFGAANFDGADRFLEIAVRRANSGNFVTLAPRQKLTSAPYSIQTLKANDAARLGGTAASQYVLTTDPRLSATNYVQNGTTAQTGVNFNVGGTGTANVLNAGTQFNLGGSRFLSGSNIANIFAGKNAGAVNSTGDANSFFGYNAGQVNTTGDNNSFFGTASGGVNNTGRFNSFFGASSGEANSTGGSNSFFGQSSGGNNTSGSSNSFFGMLSGGNNQTGSNNSTLGANANFSAINLNYATAIGAGATVGTSNTLVLGRSNDGVQVPGALNVGSSIGVGTQFYLGNRTFISTGGNAASTYNTYVGVDSACNNANGSNGIGNTIVGFGSGMQCTTGSNNSVFGYGAGRVGTGTGNTLIGAGTRVADGATVNNSTAIGAFATVSTSDTVVIGRNTATTLIPGDLKVKTESGGYLMQTVTSTNSNYGPGIAVNALYLARIGQIYLDAHLCFQGGVAGNGYLAVGNCANYDGLSKLKTNVKPFMEGLNIVKRLKPVSFKWKENDSTGIGLNADEVASVSSNLVSRDEKGEVANVNKNSLNAVLINAIQEQQKQIESQQKQIDALKNLLCSTNKDAAVCQEEKE